MYRTLLQQPQNDSIMGQTGFRNWKLHFVFLLILMTALSFGAANGVTCSALKALCWGNINIFITQWLNVFPGRLKKSLLSSCDVDFFTKRSIWVHFSFNVTIFYFTTYLSLKISSSAPLIFFQPCLVSFTFLWVTIISGQHLMFSSYLWLPNFTPLLQLAEK